MPGISIKRGMAPNERKIESLLLKERRFLIESGTDRRFIIIHDNILFVKKKKYGMILDSSFKKFPLVSDIANDLSSSSSSSCASFHPVVTTDNLQSTSTDAEINAQNYAKVPSFAINSQSIDLLPTDSSSSHSTTKDSNQ